MTSVPSLLHDEILREAGRAGMRRATGARLVRRPLPPVARTRREDGGGRRGDAPAAPAPAPLGM